MTSLQAQFAGRTTSRISAVGVGRIDYRSDLAFALHQNQRHTTL